MAPSWPYFTWFISALSFVILYVLQCQYLSSTFLTPHFSLKLPFISKTRESLPAPIIFFVPERFFVSIRNADCLRIWEVVVNGGFETLHDNPFMGPSTETLVETGGKWVPFIVSRRESWRLFTAIFTHAGFGICIFLRVLILQCIWA